MSAHYGYLLRVLHWCHDQVMTQALEQMELTASQGHLMAYLSHQSEAPCSRDIEEAFHLSHPTVSGLLQRLEQKGFIACRPDPADKRKKRVYVLPKGQECHEVMHKAIRENETRLVQGFSPEEQAQFAAFLNRAIDNMGGNPKGPKEVQKP